MAVLFKFRCYQCEKLLGAPPSKFGTVVHCPRCRAELIVPTPDDATPAPDEPEGEAIRLEDLGLRLEPEPAPPPPPDPTRPDPIAFLERAAESETDRDGLPSEEDPESDVPPGLPEPPDPADSPLVPGSRRRGRSALVEPPSRRRDVVLPRTAVVAWALFALLALASAFAAGLLVGHFLWR